MKEYQNNSDKNLKVIKETIKTIDSELKNFYNVSPMTNISLIEEYRIIVEKE